MELTANNISRTIKDRLILNKVSLNLRSNNVYGFTGRNGSGKTMLFRALSGLMRIDSGTVTLDGKVLHKDFDILPGLGITIENSGLYSEYTGYKNLKLLAGINKKITDEEIKQALDDVGLDHSDKRTVKKYSMGMKQRLAVAQAIMERPDVLMLDEPTNGLDESGVKLIRDIILRERERGAIILLASHNKEDISELADTLFKVDNGCVTES
jgi:ABC-2 type transport system ATP-binding protein